MKIIGVSASARKESISSEALRFVLEKLKAMGHETLSIDLNDGILYGCRACMACKKAPSLCRQNDVLKEYFDILHDVDAVIFAGANYMGNVQAQGISFMNRHYCVTDANRASKLKKGKKFAAIFAQGSPDKASYEKVYNDFLRPFYSCGFEKGGTLILAGGKISEEDNELLGKLAEKLTE